MYVDAIKEDDWNAINDSRKGLLFVTNFVPLMDDNVYFTDENEVPDDIKTKREFEIANGTRVPAVLIGDKDYESGGRDTLFMTRSRSSEMSGFIKINKFMFWRYFPRKVVQEEPEEGVVSDWFISTFEEMDENDGFWAYAGLTKSMIHYTVISNNGYKEFVYPFIDTEEEFMNVHAVENELYEKQEGTLEEMPIEE